MTRKILAFVFVASILAVFAVSCQNESEENRAVVTVASINENSSFLSDVVEQGDTLYDPVLGAPNPYINDDFVSPDNVAVTFYNRPYNDFTTTGPGKPLNDFLVTQYRVEWRLAAGGAGTVPPMFEGATSILVPSNTLVTAAVLLVPLSVKADPAFQALQYPSSAEVLAIAHLTFLGHEVGTDREWSFEAELSVSFADWFIKTKDKKKLQ
jgi:hypothetical protein